MSIGGAGVPLCPQIEEPADGGCDQQQQRHLVAGRGVTEVLVTGAVVQHDLRARKK